MRHLADVEMVGPPEVAEKAKAVQGAVFKHWQAHLRQNGGPFAEDEIHNNLETALNEYQAEARNALGLAKEEQRA